MNKNETENEQLNQLKNKLVDLSQLMVHPQEQAVKPLVGNKEIERV